MNERLQFSWGHIIAFVALIAVSYISFMGITYLTAGNFVAALAGMAIIDILLMLFFIGAQQMKASGEHINRKIIFERIFIFGSPIVFIAAMMPMSHFWTVKSNETQIVNTFQGAISSAKQLFPDYEKYSQNRIDAYGKSLDQIISSGNPSLFAKAGFVEGKTAVQKQNMLETLRLQLLSENYTAIKTPATEWLDNATQSASIWNVFLLGNTREIKEALEQWEGKLKGFSEKQMSNEALLSEVPQFSSNGVSAALSQLDQMSTNFTRWHFPAWSGIIFGIVIYLMLLFPYILQERHTKSIYRLIGNEHSRQADNDGWSSFGDDSSTKKRNGKNRKDGNGDSDNGDNGFLTSF